MKLNDGDRDSGVQVLARAAELLRRLKTAPAGLTQAEMAAQLDLARTTVHRIVGALAAQGLVEPAGSGGRYRLGTEVIRLAEAARTGLISEIHARLHDLSREVEETVDLSVLDRGGMTFVDQVVAPHRLRAVSAIGASFPLHCTANGKAVLAALPPRDVERLLPAVLERFTPTTITTNADLEAELDRIRGDGGLAFDREEHALGISAVGMAIRGTGLGPAAVSIPMPTHRFDEKRDAASDALRRAVARVEASGV